MATYTIIMLKFGTTFCGRLLERNGPPVARSKAEGGYCVETILSFFSLISPNVAEIRLNDLLKEIARPPLLCRERIEGGEEDPFPPIPVDGFSEIEKVVVASSSSKVKLVSVMRSEGQ